MSARFRSAQACASGESSTAYTRVPGTSVATALAIAPDPVHRSTTTAGGASAGRSRSRSIAQPVITSVSGRGTKAPGPTARVR